MLNGIFCHYLPIYKDINGNYCSTTMTNDLFSRYLDVCDNLTIATRVYDLNTTADEAHQEILNLPNIKILEFPNLSSPKIFLTQYFKHKKRLAENMRDKDLIFIRGGVIAVMAADIAVKMHKPYFAEAAGCAWDEYWNYSLLGKFLAPFMESGSRKIIKNAAFTLYVTEKWLQKKYPSNGITEYASDVVLEKIDDEALEKRLLKIQNMRHQNQIIFGTTGGIANKAKGQHFFIQAMKKLQSEFNFRYELTGGGSNEFLKAQAQKYNLSDKVVFNGELKHDEVFKWLDQIDVYIQPSMQEGLSRAVVEALSRACPVIVSSTGGNPELVDEDCIFKRGDVNDLVRVLKKFMAGNLKERAIKNFEHAKNYQSSKLDERRRNFFRQYCDYVTGGKN